MTKGWRLVECGQREIALPQPTANTSVPPHVLMKSLYQFTFSYNRQFRYEEKDDKGYVKGRYGFFDRYGKLKVVNYSADPYKGFHAEGAHVH